jgi:hypothetical protein
MAKLILENLERLRAEPGPHALTGSRLAAPPAPPASAETAAALAEAVSQAAACRGDLASRTSQEPADPRFVRRNRFLVFTGTLAPEDIPDHRALREDRIDSLLPEPDA